MERYEAFNNFYGEGYEDTLPRELVEAYDIIECLSCTDGCDTLLLKQKSTGKKMVAKCYTGDSTLLDQAEDAKQEDIRCTALPYFVGEYRNETYRCILREYIATGGFAPDDTGICCTQKKKDQTGSSFDSGTGSMRDRWRAGVPDAGS